MSAAAVPAQNDQDSVDQAALRLMLSYVEAECLRIGATDAARHAALAASLVPVPQAPQPDAAKPRLPRPRAQGRARGVRVH